MNALLYTIQLHEPLLATQPQVGEPNSSVSLDYVPGSMIRGAVISAHGKDGTDPAAAEKWYERFFSGRVRFLNAYPQDPEAGNRMLPVPRSWFVEKDDVGRRNVPIHDHAVADSSLEQPKAPTGSFVWHADGHVELDSLPLVSSVHTTGEDRNRKSEGDSQVFRYEAIAAGQTLVGAIVADSADELAGLAPALGRIQRLGGARTAGYGRVTVTVLSTKSNWKEFEPAAVEGSSTEKRVVVTLLSDAILRGADGQTGADLAEALGLPSPVAAFQQLRLVGGFNRTWGLPLAQAWAVAAGSVYVFERDDALLTKLAPLVASGIGERIVEGFGRLAVDWQGSPNLEQERLERELALPARPPELTAASQALAATMARRQLEVHIQQSLVKQIRRLTTGLPAKELPSAAQLSRARLAARRASDAADLQIVTKHFGELKSAASQWEHATVHKLNLRSWILEQAQLTREAFLQQFGLQLHITAQQGAVAGVEAEISGELQAKTVARLIEGVLAQAVKVKKAEEKG